jgi:hypothetical protein
MRGFLRTIIFSSEKAASLARACRKEKDLFQLLVEVSLSFSFIIYFYFHRICHFIKISHAQVVYKFEIVFTKKKIIILLKKYFLHTWPPLFLKTCFKTLP